MAKNGQLWDDSSLVKALNDAISKYKIMHDKGDDNGYLKEEIRKDTEESTSDETNEAKSAPYIETDNSTDPENCTSEASEQSADLSNGNQMQNSDCTNVNAERAEQYNLLLYQFNAIEEQRQKLLQQLYQYGPDGNWDPQSYGYGYGYGYGYSTSYGSQYNPVPAPQTSIPPVFYCHPYVYPSSTSLAQNGNSVSVDDDRFIKAAMGAVDKAIHSSEKGIPDVNKEEKKEEEAVTTSHTDLSIVMNAWFSAGFYTGKYLSEQASAKK